jgi:hypothetical protein
MNTVIILTATVNVGANPSGRLQIYMKAIRKWLIKSRFNICLVENSGYNFDELNEEKEKYKERFEVITYNEKDLDEAKHLKSHEKGEKELIAINYAFQKSKFINPDCFIIKVTGRYYIPNFDDYLDNFDLNSYDCITQNKRTRCEMVGCTYKNFPVIFSKRLVGPSGKADYFVERVYEARTSKFAKILVCKPFTLDEKTFSGTGFGYWLI